MDLSFLRLGISCLLISTALYGCGGGEDEEEEEEGLSPRGPTYANGYNTQLTKADNLSEFIAQVKIKWPKAEILTKTSSDMSVWHSVKDLPQAYALTNLNNNPIFGTYKSYSANDYPVQNGILVFGNTGADLKRMTFQVSDLINNSTSAGDSQAFYGVAETNSFIIGTIGAAVLASTNVSIPTTIVTEDLIYDSTKTLQYRSIRTFIGYLTNYTPKAQTRSGTPVVGPPFNGIVGDMFVGYYDQQVVECYVANCEVGYMLRYDIFMAR